MINHVARGVGAVSNTQLCLFHITIGDYILDIWEKLRTSLRLFVDSLHIQLYHTVLKIRKFYDHPKIRKKDSPLRPIDSSIGSVMYNTAMFSDKIWRLLVGLKGRHIINREDFVKTTRELKFLLERNSSHTILRRCLRDAMPVVRAKLEDDRSLPERCPLDVPQLFTLLEMCLPSTYFTYQNEFYKQKQGVDNTFTW